MSDYYERDERPYMAQISEELAHIGIGVERELKALERIQEGIQFEEGRRDNPDLVFRSEEQRSLLKDEIKELLGAICTGSSVAVRERIEHLLQIREVEESFTGQQGSNEV